MSDIRVETHWVGDRCPGGHYDDPPAVIARIDCLEAALQDSVKRNESLEAALKQACRNAGIAWTDGPDSAKRMAEALRTERLYKRTGAYSKRATQHGRV